MICKKINVWKALQAVSLITTWTWLGLGWGRCRRWGSRGGFYHIQELQVKVQWVDSHSKVVTSLMEIFLCQVLVVLYEFSLVKSVFELISILFSHIWPNGEFQHLCHIYFKGRWNLHVFLELSFCLKYFTAFFTFKSNFRLFVWLSTTIASVGNRSLSTESLIPKGFNLQKKLKYSPT